MKKPLLHGLLILQELGSLVNHQKILILDTFICRVTRDVPNLLLEGVMCSDRLQFSQDEDPKSKDGEQAQSFYRSIYMYVRRSSKMTTIHPVSTNTANITPRQLEVLANLTRRERWSLGEVASVLGVSSAAATKVIARLERKGLVSRVVDAIDRRCVNIRITRAGNDALKQGRRYSS
jgi:DNA-binding MarR family transcriptional regulator